MPSKKESKSKKKKSKKTNRKKTAIIEPLYKEAPPTFEKQQELEDAAIHIADQPEFDKVLFPLFELHLIFLQKLLELEPDMERLAMEKSADPALRRIYDQAFVETAKKALTLDIALVEEIRMKLLAIKNRIKFEFDPLLEQDVQLMLEFFNKSHSLEEVAQFPLLRELILKHFTLIDEFSHELEIYLGQTFDQILAEGPVDMNKFNEIVESFEDRYPGFINLMNDLQEEDTGDNEDANSEEEFERIYLDGIFNVTNGSLHLDLFTRKELDTGRALAEHFYMGLSSSEKRKLANLNKGFIEKASEFNKTLQSYLSEICTPKRKARMVKKLETIIQKKKYEQWQQFIFYISKALTLPESELNIIPLLSFIYSAQAKRLPGKGMKIFTFLSLEFLRNVLNLV